MNVIKGAMENYRKCKNWLEKYNRQIETYYMRMEGNTSSSIIGMPDGDIDPNADGKRKSAINDELNEFKKSNKAKYIHSLNTVTLCEINFELVKEQYQNVFDKVYVQGLKPNSIELGDVAYSSQRIYQILDEETMRLSKL